MHSGLCSKRNFLPTPPKTATPAASAPSPAALLCGNHFFPPLQMHPPRPWQAGAGMAHISRPHPAESRQDSVRGGKEREVRVLISRGWLLPCRALWAGRAPGPEAWALAEASPMGLSPGSSCPSPSLFPAQVLHQPLCFRWTLPAPLEVSPLLNLPQTSNPGTLSLSFQDPNFTT